MQALSCCFAKERFVCGRNTGVHGSSRACRLGNLRALQQEAGAWDTGGVRDETPPAVPLEGRKPSEKEGRSKQELSTGSQRQCPCVTAQQRPPEARRASLVQQQHLCAPPSIITQKTSLRLPCRAPALHVALPWSQLSPW